MAYISSPDLVIKIKGEDKATDTLEKVGKAVEDTGKKAEKTAVSAKKLLVGFSGVATSAFSLYNAVDKVQDMQVSLNRANVTVKSSLNSVEDAQRRLNATIEKYGADSDEAKAAMDDLKLSQDRYQVSVERADMIQGNLNETIMQSTLQVIPTAITMASSLSQIWKSFPDMAGKLGTLSSKIGDVGSSAATAAISAGAFTGAFVGGMYIFDTLPQELQDTAAALGIATAAVIAGAVAWMAYHGAMTMGAAVPIISAAIGLGVAGLYELLTPEKKGFSGTVYPTTGKVPLPSSPFGPSMYKVPTGAEGGLITKPTLLVAGEAGPEALVPLEQGVGGVTINQYFEVSEWTDLDKVREAAAEGATLGISESLRRRGR